MSLTFIILLIIAGLILLVVEVLIIPGSTVVGILGFASMVFAIFQAYSVHGSTTGHIVLAATLVSTVVSLYYMLKARTWNRLMLKDAIESRVNVIKEGTLKTGDTGQTVSRLNPAGKARFGNELYEVHTRGDFLDPGSPIVITKLDGPKIYVELIKE
ncbi:MAG TPA: NfeD family protein [Bacteroidales bacterium]|nr:NfeD family protein [Bacteroidales bacterium]HSA44714.1 NfeD family protein [Bacteroidales bacterium]